ncbi:MAG: hypothetical protein ABR970_11000 [Roseiarcus sp.]|jgi:hypothetical protein
MRAPIVIMSYNRPHYLKPVLESLRNQRPGGLDGREIHLFQDGAVNLFSGFRYAKDEDIQASVETFRSYFPEGRVHPGAVNIGICENFYRAEHFVFDTLGAECAYFFEDDLVLSPAYLQMMETLESWARSMPNVAYFSAYGNYYAEAEELAAGRRDLINLDHHWAFGLVRRHWAKMQPQLEAYYQLVRGTDYSRRFDREIFDLYQNCDAAPPASSQDAAKAFACDRLGLWRCNTMTPFAKYIGVHGQHMTQQAFDSIGFERTVVADEPIEDLRFPDVAHITTYLAEQHALFKQVRRAQWAELIASFPAARVWDPGRKCRRDDVVFGYRLFLNREPESEERIEKLVGRQTVFDFVNGLVASEEHAGLPAAQPQRLCVRDDVTFAYRLCLYRDPENEQVYEEHVGKTDAFTLTHAIWNGGSRPKLWATITPVWA